MGPSKLKIVEKFPVSTFIDGNRGKDIENLWRRFYLLYCTMQCNSLSEEKINQFTKDARQWVQDFARPTIKTFN
ncbi:32899_t:CDS:1, partial [Racocetra persica]